MRVAMQLALCTVLSSDVTAFSMPSAALTTDTSQLQRVPQPVLQARDPSVPVLLVPEVALGLGSSLLVLLVTNRLFTPELLNSQSRADLIATLAPVLIVLKALSDLDITPRQAEPVPLDGSHVEWVEPSLPSPARGELEWAADALMQSESCVAVVIYHEGRTLLQRGTLPTPASAEKEQGEPAVAVKPGPLLTKCMQRVNGAPEYLPALQLLPGRVEFGYLPSLTQGVLMVPLVGSTGVRYRGEPTPFGAHACSRVPSVHDQVDMLESCVRACTLWCASTPHAGSAHCVHAGADSGVQSATRFQRGGCSLGALDRWKDLGVIGGESVGSICR